VGAAIAAGVQRVGAVPGVVVVAVEAHPGGTRPGALQLGEEGGSLAATGRMKLGCEPQLRPPSVERHTVRSLASQPSSGAVKQTDCGGAGAAYVAQVWPPSLVCTSLVAGTDRWSLWSAPPATPQPWVGPAKWT